VLQGLRGAIEPLQAERERIACRDILRRQRDGPLEQPHGLLEPSFGFETRCEHVQQQRVLEAFGESLLGNGRGSRYVPILRQRQYGAQHSLIGFEVTGHADMMPEAGATPRAAHAWRCARTRQKNGGPKPAVIYAMKRVSS
jgi:hypothetical protein